MLRNSPLQSKSALHLAITQSGSTTLDDPYLSNQQYQKSPKRNTSILTNIRGQGQNRKNSDLPSLGDNSSDISNDKMM